MSAIDLLRAARPFILDRTIPRRIVFHHVPKCGGTSVGRALRRRHILSQGSVTPEASYKAFADYSGRNDRDQMLVDVVELRTQMMLYEMHRDTRCIALHVPFSPTAHARFGDDYAFVTLLRNPVERFISHFRWASRPGAGHARIDLPLEAFLETARARRMGAAYVEYFSGDPTASDLADPRKIDAAITNLGLFAVVGRLGALTRFRSDMRETCEVRLSIRHENRARTPAPPIDDETMARIRDLCQPDIAVWEHFDA